MPDKSNKSPMNNTQEMASSGKIEPTESTNVETISLKIQPSEEMNRAKECLGIERDKNISENSKGRSEQMNTKNVCSWPITPSTNETSSVNQQQDYLGVNELTTSQFEDDQQLVSLRNREPAEHIKVKKISNMKKEVNKNEKCLEINSQKEIDPHSEEFRCQTSKREAKPTQIEVPGAASKGIISKKGQADHGISNKLPEDGKYKPTKLAQRKLKSSKDILHIEKSGKEKKTEISSGEVTKASSYPSNEEKCTIEHNEPKLGSISGIKIQSDKTNGKLISDLKEVATDVPEELSHGMEMPKTNEVLPTTPESKTDTFPVKKSVKKKGKKKTEVIKYVLSPEKKVIHDNNQLTHNHAHCTYTLLNKEHTVGTEAYTAKVVGNSSPANSKYTAITKSSPADMSTTTCTKLSDETDRNSLHTKHKANIKGSANTVNNKENSNSKWPTRLDAQGSKEETTADSYVVRKNTYPIEEDSSHIKDKAVNTVTDQATILFIYLFIY